MREETREVAPDVADALDAGDFTRAGELFLKMLGEHTIKLYPPKQQRPPDPPIPGGRRRVTAVPLGLAGRAPQRPRVARPSVDRRPPPDVGVHPEGRPGTSKTAAPPGFPRAGGRCRG